MAHAHDLQINQQHHQLPIDSASTIRSLSSQSVDDVPSGTGLANRQAFANTPYSHLLSHSTMLPVVSTKYRHGTSGADVLDAANLDPDRQMYDYQRSLSEGRLVDK